MTDIDAISAAVLEEAIALHRQLGPGLFESVYETVLAGRLSSRGLRVERQVAVPLVFDEHHFDAAFRIDILVEGRLVLEIKSVERLGKAHAKQLLPYLRILNQPVGLLLIFSHDTMMEGVRRLVNDYRPAPSSSAASAPPALSARNKRQDGWTS